jgi:hypothetical protein
MATNNLKTRLTGYDFETNFYKDLNRTKLDNQKQNGRLFINNFLNTYTQDNMNSANIHNSRISSQPNKDYYASTSVYERPFAYDNNRNLFYLQTLSKPQFIPSVNTLNY